MFTFCEWLLVLLRNRRIRDTEHLIYRSASPLDDTVSTIQKTALLCFGVYTVLRHTAEVYQYRVERKQTRTGEITHQTQYGITSLSPQEASEEDLLKLRRGHWTIENKVHRIRDVVFAEDASQVRTGGIPEVMAALRNTVLSVLRFNGYTKISQTIRFFAARPKLAVKLII